MSAARGRLGAVIREMKASHKLGLGDLTVLAPQNDPYRLDTAAGHRDAAWFAEHFNRVIGLRASLHLRGCHYAFLGVLKPDGKPYENTAATWDWIQAGPAKAARWLGYVPFDKIRDARNDEPIVRRHDEVTPGATVSPGDLSIYLPDLDDLAPKIDVTGFEGRQPYRLVLFGEKSSLADVLGPIAEIYGADIYLPTGEISDTLLFQMARDGAQDGRPMRVFTLSDCDPAGHQMPISIGRKLQALRDLAFHDLDFEVRPVALTVEQVRELGLPSTPLKETERRGDRWRAAFEVEQTEIDALATLRPDVLRRIVTDALDPFFDHDLDHRVWVARAQWREAAQARLDAQIGPEFLADLRVLAEDRFAELEEQVRALKDELYVPAPEDLELPPLDVPEPAVDESLHGEPLVSSRWSWLDQTAALKARKAYAEGD